MAGLRPVARAVNSRGFPNAIVRKSLTTTAAGGPFVTRSRKTQKCATASIPTQNTRNQSLRRHSSTAIPQPPTGNTETSQSEPSPSSTKTSPVPPRRSILLTVLTTSGLIVVFFVAGFTMAAAPAAEAINGFVNPPTDAETLSMFEPATPTAAEINERIINHPLSRRLRAEEKNRESRPHLKIPAAMREHNFTAATLQGPNKLEVPPLTFVDTEAELPTLTQISYLGSGLCGHPGIVHGGLLATLLDEGLARACFPALPNHVGVTASLNINYRSPCPGNSYIVLKAETTKVEGRKAWVKGWIEVLGEEDGNGTKLVEAEALFIEPKNAANMARIYSSQR